MLGDNNNNLTIRKYIIDFFKYKTTFNLNAYHFKILFLKCCVGFLRGVF